MSYQQEIVGGYFWL